MLGRIFRRKDPEMDAGRALYDRVVEQARAPVFYRDLGVPDTLDGRFDAIVLHATLVIRRLQRASTPLAERGQAVFDALIDDMDRSLRELGAGDLGVAPRVKRMAQGFYGRFDAYSRALDGEGALGDTLARNLYGTVAEPDPRALERMAAYVSREAERLDSLPNDAFGGDSQVFGDPPAPATAASGAGD